MGVKTTHCQMGQLKLGTEALKSRILVLTMTFISAIKNWKYIESNIIYIIKLYICMHNMWTKVILNCYIHTHTSSYHRHFYILCNWISDSTNQLLLHMKGIDFFIHMLLAECQRSSAMLCYACVTWKRMRHFLYWSAETYFH